MAAARRDRASSCRRRRTSSRSTATRSKRGSTPRTRRRASCRASARLEHFDLGDDGRIETGVEEGDAISPFYDPMIAKLIAVGDDRDEAIDELAAILDEVEVWPVRTNAGFLFNALLAPRLRRGEDRHRLHRAQSRRAGARPRAGRRDLARRGGGRDSRSTRTRSRSPSSPASGSTRRRDARVALGRGGEFRSVGLDDDSRWPRSPAFATTSGSSSSTKARPTSSRSPSRGTGTAHGVHDGEIEAPMPGQGDGGRGRGRAKRLPRANAC